MILAIVLIIAAALSLVFVLSIAVSRSLVVSGDSGQPQLQPIDLAAFRNLVDPAETDYLRHRLSTHEFRTVQRERLRAMATYIQAAGRNAAILIQIGQPALSSNDPHTAEAGRQLIERALLLRRNAIFALCKIYVVLAWPTSGLGVAPVLNSYERLNGSAMLLGRLQNPAAPVRISATL
ncbi:MAG TPA: hypothetical protein VHW45_11300 [Candidatus Sulfotelmatobacter sp.]|nr:hypothetical protein [Candidatus Sulfotelmatobacter sp.]